MIISLKEEVFRDIEENGTFTADGCACGSFVYKLTDEIWIHVDRSCRKSNYTSDEKLWHLREVDLYKNIKCYYDNHNGLEFLSDVDLDDDLIIKNARIKQSDEARLIEVLKKITKECYPHEYRNE